MIMFIPDPDPTFYQSRIPDAGIKKAPDSGSATLETTKRSKDYEYVRNLKSKSERLERLCKCPMPSVADPDPVTG
jgi:hypothetical protein